MKGKYAATVLSTGFDLWHGTATEAYNCAGKDIKMSTGAEPLNLSPISVEVGNTSKFL